MYTQLLSLDLNAPLDSQLSPAVSALQNDGLVCCPSETVYGLCANALSDKAVKGIFHAKGRPSDNPLIVHISSTDMLPLITSHVPSYVKPLMDHFWPGPISFVLPACPNLPSIVTAGLSTVAVRMPSHPVMSSLISNSNLPLAAPSANTSGRPSPTLAKHCMEDLEGKVDVVIDGGSSAVGIESTVVDVTSEVPVILRPGVIGIDDLYQVLNIKGPCGDVCNEISLSSDSPRCPGLRHKHYAPEGDVMLIDDCTEVKMNGGRVGVLVTRDLIGDLIDDCDSFDLVSMDDLSDLNLDKSSKSIIFDCGIDANSFAKNLYSALRLCDDFLISTIFILKFSKNSPVKLALMNRIEKAASKV
ncbi:hypothetical protein P9112_008605 [Eukaryota sp. TZLM1-RC]